MRNNLKRILCLLLVLCTVITPVCFFGVEASASTDEYEAYIIPYGKNNTSYSGVKINGYYYYKDMEKAIEEANSFQMSLIDVMSDNTTLMDSIPTDRVVITKDRTTIALGGVYNESKKDYYYAEGTKCAGVDDKGNRYGVGKGIVIDLNGHSVHGICPGNIPLGEILVVMSSVSGGFFKELDDEANNGYCNGDVLVDFKNLRTTTGDTAVWPAKHNVYVLNEANKFKAQNDKTGGKYYYSSDIVLGADEYMQTLINRYGKDSLSGVFNSDNIDENGVLNYKPLYDLIGNQNFKTEKQVDITSGSSSGYTLKDGTTYNILSSVEFTSNQVGVAGMTVEPGSKVFINIAEGVTLTAKGHDASGTSGATAGICVPENSFLIILGKGTLKAYGGNASKGTAGSNGENSYFSSSGRGSMYAGNGGNGGNGGGGAAAGIGGNGGNGGLGGAGGVFAGKDDVTLNGHNAVPCESSGKTTADCHGTNGEKGQDGGSGFSCGTICIFEGPKVYAYAGNAEHGNGDTGSKGAVSGDYGSGYSNNYSAGSAGAGGGGGGGLNPYYGIGGGGAGGPGGGGGGSGATRWQKSGRGYPNGGNGGGATYGGESGVKEGSQHGGSGGAGGAYGLQGGSGKVYIDSGNSVPDGRPAYYYDCKLFQVFDTVITRGKVTLEFGNIQKVNGYNSYNSTLDNYFSFALALYEVGCHNAAGKYTVSDPEVSEYYTMEGCNGCAKYTMDGYVGDSWFKDIVDLSGGYLYILSDVLAAYINDRIPRIIDNGSLCQSTMNPYDLIEYCYNCIVTEYSEGKGKSDNFVFSDKMNATNRKLLHAIFYWEPYAEPNGSMKSVPGYTYDHQTAYHSDKSDALDCLNNIYMTVYEPNTCRDVTITYGNYRQACVYDLVGLAKKYYYAMNRSKLTVTHNKRLMAGSTWMSSLLDDELITDVNLPGSHDAGAFNLSIGIAGINELMQPYLNAQTLDLTQQFQAGVRLLDIRLDVKQSELTVFHGPMHGRELDCSNNLTIRRVLKHCEEFLNENPTEFIVLMYNDESGRSKKWKELEGYLVDSFKNKSNRLILFPDTIAKYKTNGDLDDDLISTAQIPTVGDCRGKIILLEAHQINKWEDHYDCLPVSKAMYLKEKFNTAYKISVESGIKVTSSKDDNNPNPRVLFASTYNAGEFYNTILYLISNKKAAIPNPVKAGDEVNGWLVNYPFKESYKYGWIFLNNSQPEVCRSIYISNLTDINRAYQLQNGDGSEDIKVVATVFGKESIPGIIIESVIIIGAIALTVVLVRKKKKKAEKPIN